MNPFLQNVLAITALILALGFIVAKFIWKPKKKKGNGCGEDNCGCH
ncbi:attachment p12 family protein [Flavobacteriaceae bacterium MAR_2010_72]|nr:attachment p12 family protein [Flavobacteriaceae bacterium MAR_2010_72]TVZ58172.1 attachment p12 family protein [Flavobacteriaceae bacterium MAR_2010_105]